MPFGKCAGGAEGEDVAVFQPTGHVGAADRADVGVCKLFLIVVVLFELLMIIFLSLVKLRPGRLFDRLCQIPAGLPSRKERTSILQSLDANPTIRNCPI